jgi:hypothetical protein
MAVIIPLCRKAGKRGDAMLIIVLAITTATNRRAPAHAHPRPAQSRANLELYPQEWLLAYDPTNKGYAQ